MAGPDDAGIVADHLRWLFLRCERPDGRWVRSHYVDGARKDRPFQADLQLYPILELTDFVEATGWLPELPAGSSWADLVATAWSAVEAAIDGDTGLIRADESPADDALNHPFALSNQILLWLVAARLAVTAGRLGMPARPFAELATRTKAAVEEHLIVEGPLGRQWAFAVDARGASELYHDANDLPVARHRCGGSARPTTLSGERRCASRSAPPIRAGCQAGMVGSARDTRPGPGRSVTSSAGSAPRSVETWMARRRRWNGSSRSPIATTACSPKPTTRKAVAQPSAIGSPGPGLPSRSSTSSTQGSGDGRVRRQHTRLRAGQIESVGAASC